MADLSKLNEICALTYKEQAIWFLNAFWDTFGEKEADKVWDFTHKFGEFDLQKGKEGNALDELNAHRFLESFSLTMTVREMREKLRKKGAIEGSVKLVPFTHFLAIHYDIDWHHLVHAPQGKKEEVVEAQRRLDDANFQLSEAIERSNEAKAAAAAAKAAEQQARAREEEARAREEEALAREAEAREREAPFKKAQEELEQALAELQAQEEAYAAKTADLTRRSEEGGVVSRNKAKNELAQHLGEDPLPLRRAKITSEAAHKRAEKARAPFEEATKQAEAARQAATAAAEEAAASRQEAERTAQEAERAAQAADAQVEKAKEAFAEAEAYLEEVKNSIGYGQSWWIDRELHEAKKYMPTSRGGIARN